MRGVHWVIAVLALAGNVTAHAGPVLDRIKERRTLVIAYREGAQPFSYAIDGRPVGYAVELCERIADGLRRRLGLPGLSLRYEPVSAESRIPAIVEGRADIECGSTSNTDERREKVAFSIPHYISGTRYLVRADSVVRSLNDLSGARVATTEGTSVLKALEQADRERALGMKIMTAPDHAAAFALVREGKADAFALDEVLLFGLLATAERPTDYRVVGTFLNVDPYGLMLSKQDRELRQLVDDEFRELIYSRRAHELYAKWFGKPIPWQRPGTAKVQQISLQLPMNLLLREYWKVPTSPAQ